MAKLLLLSNSTLPGTPFFTWPRPFVTEFLGQTSKTLLFIPFAAVTFPVDEYEAIVKKAFGEMGYTVTSIHTISDKEKAIREAGAIITGGGNTFALLTRLYEQDLVQPLRDAVLGGTPYIGWSAGANLACPTIMTTNDMPVVQPPSFEALNLAPFQINPHYHELRFEGQGGETRKERLEEFLVMNPHRVVVGLPEGMLVHVEGNAMILKGTGIAKLYRAGKPMMEVGTGTDLYDLLTA